MKSYAETSPSVWTLPLFRSLFFPSKPAKEASFRGLSSSPLASIHLGPSSFFRLGLASIGRCVPVAPRDWQDRPEGKLGWTVQLADAFGDLQSGGGNFRICSKGAQRGSDVNTGQWGKRRQEQRQQQRLFFEEVGREGAR